MGKATRDSDDVLEVVVSPARGGMNIIVEGARFEADLDTNSDHDIVVPEERDLQGVRAEVANFSDGDWVSLTVHKADPGDDEVARFANKVRVPPSGRVGVLAQSSSTVPVGFKIRITYHSVATTGPKPIIYSEYITWK